MSNHLSIAAVTAVFQHLLQSRIGMEGLIIKVGTPDAPVSDASSPVVNICLYQVTPNSAYQNYNLPCRDSTGKNIINQPTIALDLYYLLSFYGDSQTLIAERLLGKTLQLMHTYPILSASSIKTVLTTLTRGQSVYDFLMESDLADTMPEELRFSLQSTSLEELTKLWSAFFAKIPYTLSIAYRASVVLISADEKINVAPAVTRFEDIHVEVQAK